jgi:hypothetical protein
MLKSDRKKDDSISSCKGIPKAESIIVANIDRHFQFFVKGVWGEAMRQIGNAVPVLLSEIMGKELMKILTDRDRDMKSEIASKLEQRQLVCNDI